MFYTKYVQMCNNVNKSPSAVAKECGLTAASMTGWANGAEPRDATKKKIADYFGVDVSFFSENLKDIKEDVLTEQEKELLIEFRKKTEEERKAYLIIIKGK